MPLIRKNRTAQYPLMAEFSFGVADTMADTTGVTKAFNAAGSNTFDVIGLPPGATLIGGELVVSTASNDAGTATVSVGDSANPTRYLAATSIKAAGRTALSLTGYVGTGEDLRITVANGTGGASAGAVTLRGLYTVQNRSNETQIS